jgi:hypothetical protein
VGRPGRSVRQADNAADAPTKLADGLDAAVDELVPAVDAVRSHAVHGRGQRHDGLAHEHVPPALRVDVPARDVDELALPPNPIAVDAHATTARYWSFIRLDG